MRPAYLVPAGLALLIALSLTTGVARLSMDREALWLIAVSRLPRTAAAMLAGAGLAVAGIIMQMLARNRFVEPATVGTGQAAGLGLVAVTVLLPGAALWLKMLISTGTALSATGLFLLIIRRLPPRDPLLVPLTGIVYGGILGAVATFIAYENDLLQYLDIWMSGEFSGVMLGRYEFLWFAGAISLLAYVFANRFTLAGMGEDMSRTLGLNYGRVMALGLTIVSVVTAVIVVTVGMLPFVGLVVPNIASRLMGDNLRHSLPWLAMFGAALVLACDILGRLVIQPYEIPVGTILGVIGAAVFIWMLQGRNAHAA
ncbi:putative ironIII transport permease protein [Pseudooceanicola batsensis HTCC2597]|uniref:Putative ironIII transport permease protein n=1 Tax=Pseudooceanicola batsensis (strain ATCC BAA-863 / DSM 15984 / KCTC 12145 / HTCC2597) TaxID=252305 RepID=A3TU88_PSEBH|nr:iron chelate uptake ABC transporter family permease subunit [Pseudooceanicola batsensis]EAQ04084.1 putative ironIII transport permease protein [Pseudooceanicola batsensis HTCC2597]